MKQIIKILLDSLSKEFVMLLSNIILTVKEYFSYKNIQQKNKLEKANKEKIEKYNNSVDNVIDNGTIDELLSLKK